MSADLGVKEAHNVLAITDPAASGRVNDSDAPSKVHGAATRHSLESIEERDGVALLDAWLEDHTHIRRDLRALDELHVAAALAAQVPLALAHVDANLGGLAARAVLEGGGGHDLGIGGDQLLAD